MNNKGFTLVELLATIVILGLVMGIATYGFIGTVNNSEKKTEKIFVDKLGIAIEEYLSLYGGLLDDSGSSVKFNKCFKSDCYNEDSDTYIEGKYYEVSANELSSIKMSNLVLAGVLDSEAVINPSNKKNCLNGVDPTIKVFKDSDYVYYYYVDLRGDNTSCEISDENGIINTLPDALVRSLNEFMGDDYLEI